MDEGMRRTFPALTFTNGFNSLPKMRLRRVDHRSSVPALRGHSRALNETSEIRSIHRDLPRGRYKCPPLLGNIRALRLGDSIAVDLLPAQVGVAPAGPRPAQVHRTSFANHFRRSPVTRLRSLLKYPCAPRCGATLRAEVAEGNSGGWRVGEKGALWAVWRRCSLLTDRCGYARRSRLAIQPKALPRGAHGYFNRLLIPFDESIAIVK